MQQAQMDSTFSKGTEQKEPEEKVKSFNLHEMHRVSPVKESSSPEVPDSPRDVFQAAFLQKQLAGKAPASSPRTSLWMNSAPLPTPCVLAPAAVATIDSSEPHGNERAPSPERQVSRTVIITPKN